MISQRSIASDYIHAGAFNAVVGLHSFYDDHVFFTKNGELGVVLAFPGVDFEGQDATTTDSISQRFEAAIRAFNEDFKIYHYLFKTSNPTIPSRTYREGVVSAALTSRRDWFHKKGDRLYTVETFLVLTLKAWTKTNGLSQWCDQFRHAPLSAISATFKGFFSNANATSILASDLRGARDTLVNAAHAFMVATDDVFHPHLLDKHGAFRVFRRLLNFDPAKAQHLHAPSDDLLDYYVADSTLETHHGYLRNDDYYVNVLTLKNPPASSFANTFSDLIGVDCDLLLCSKFQRVSNATATKEIRSRQRHYFNTSTSAMSALSTEPSQPGDHMVNQANTALVENLGQALTEIELHNNYFGTLSYTAVLYSQDWFRLHAAVADVNKVFATKDASINKETYNALNSYLAIVPGNDVFDLRGSLVTVHNYTDLAFLFTTSSGDPLNAHLHDEYLALFETQHRTPYYFNLHVKDVAHTLITGATGSGKSFLLNFLLTSLQKYDPFTCIFDLGGSYQHLSKLLHGSHSKISLDSNAFTINPFSLAPTPENLEFLFSFFRVLIETDNPTPMPSDDTDLLYEAIKRLYRTSERHRTLSILIQLLPKHISQPLSRWAQGGQYGTLFDHETDTLHFSDFQAFDFEGMDKFPLLIEPLLFYILHRANSAIYDPSKSARLKIFVLDEAWRFFQNPTIKQYLREALKTWRKRNAAMILATQSSDDLRQSGILEVVLESCPTRIFLANAGMNEATYREAFNLNATQASLIRNLIPKKQLFVVTPEHSKILTLDVDPRSYWIYTNSPLDNAKRDALVSQFGLDRALDILTAKEIR